MRMLYRAWTSLALIIAGALNFGFGDAQETGFEAQPLVVSLPLATQTTDGEGCKSASNLVDPTAKAYAQYLESRFNTRVTLCLFNTIGEAVEAVDETKTNFIWVDEESGGPLLETWRSSMTLLPSNGIGRTPFVLFRLNSQPEIDLENLSMSRIGFLNQPPHQLHVDAARKILSDYGLMADASETGVARSTIPALFEAVQKRDVDAAILEASSWAIYCGVLDADSTACDGYEIMIYDRPSASHAFMIPNDTALERHYRLIGVHIALHLKRPELFEWVSQGIGSEFEPTEASAMVPKSIDNPVAF